MAAALKIFLENRAFAERVGAAARLDALARFSSERIVQRFVDLYEGLLKAKVEKS